MNQQNQPASTRPKPALDGDTFSLLLIGGAMVWAATGRFWLGVAAVFAGLVVVSGYRNGWWGTLPGTIRAAYHALVAWVYRWRYGDDELEDENLKLYDIVFGREVVGGRKPVVVSLNDIEHIGIWAITGHGKTTLLHMLIHQLIRRHTPRQLKIAIADLKDGVDFSLWRTIAHLFCRVARTSAEAEQLLDTLFQEKERRARLFALAASKHQSLCNDYKRYRELTGEQLPHIVAIFDEMADVAERKSDLERKFIKAAKQFRAFGIHLICATQRPDQTTIMTGPLKGQLGVRIVGVMASNVDYGTVANVPAAVYESMVRVKGRFMMLLPGRWWQHVQVSRVPDQELAEEAFINSFDNEPQWPTAAREAVTPAKNRTLKKGRPDENRQAVLEYLVGLDERPTYDEFQADWDNCSRASVSRYLNELGLWEESRRIRGEDPA